MKIDGFSPQQLLQIISKSALEGLKAGDMLQGRVLSIESGMLFLKLLDGSTFSAKVPDGFTAQPGSLLTLQIGEKVQDQLTAKIVQPQNQAPNDQSLQSAIVKNLDVMGAKPTEALIAKVMDLMDQNSSLGVEKAAFLAANNIKPDQDMLSLMMRMALKEFQIDENLSSLRDNLLNTISSLTSSADGLDLQKTLLKPLIVQQELGDLASSLAEKLIGQDSLLTRDNQAVGQQAKMQLTKNLMEALEAQFQRGEPVTQETLNNLLQKAFSNTQLLKGQDSSQLQNALSNLLKSTDGLGFDKLNSLAQFVQRGLDDLQEKLSEGGKMGQDSIRELVSKTFEKAFIKAENGVSEPIDVQEKIKVIRDILTLANETAAHMDPNSAETNLPVVRELQNALQFFSQAGTYQTFVQIPLMMNQQNTTGELYVMRGKKKRGKIDPNQFTLFISLNTKNLGLIETFLNASNRYVTVHFRVADENLVKMVKDHHKALYEALAQKGYKLAEMRVRLHDEEPVNLFNAMKKTEDILGLKASLDLKI